MGGTAAGTESGKHKSKGRYLSTRWINQEDPSKGWERTGARAQAPRAPSGPAPASCLAREGQGKMDDKWVSLIFTGERRKQKWKRRWLLPGERKGKAGTYGVKVEPDPLPSTEIVHFSPGKKEEKAPHPPPPNSIKDSFVGAMTNHGKRQ